MAADPTQPNPLINKITFPAAGAIQAKSKLQEVLSQREEMLVQRYSAAELERMALEAEQETKRLKSESSKDNNGNNNDGGKDVENDKATEGKLKLMASARALLDVGMDAQDVGRMLLGLPPAASGTNGSQPLAPAPAGTSTKDTIELIKLFVKDKDDNDIKSMLVSMNKRLENIESGKIAPKNARNDGGDDDRHPTLSHARYVADEVKAFREMGLIPPAGAGNAKTGEDIEIVREKNRHDEEMEKVKTDREYKQKLGDTVASIPEQLGAGLAKNFMGDDDEDEDDSVPMTNQNVDRFACPGCGAPITVPKGATKFICPKCRSILQPAGTPVPTPQSPPTDKSVPPVTEKK